MSAAGSIRPAARECVRVHIRGPGCEFGVDQCGWTGSASVYPFIECLSWMPRSTCAHVSEWSRVSVCVHTCTGKSVQIPYECMFRIQAEHSTLQASVCDVPADPVQRGCWAEFCESADPQVLTLVEAA